MKRLLLFELLLIFLATTFESDSPPGWYQQTLPVNDIVNDIFFVDTLNGWVVTQGHFASNDTSYIMNTIDGGNNWLVQTKNRENLNVVQFLDINTGYAAGGTNGTVFITFYKTTNSGLNWIALNILGGIQITDLIFINKDTGWVCDPDATLGAGLQKTTNGGTSWVQQLNRSFRPSKLFFINKDTGWVSCNFSGVGTARELYRTTNGGTNWNLQFTFPQQVNDIHFFNLNIGVVSSGFNHRTTDGGSSWAQTNLGGIKLSSGSDSIVWAGTNIFQKIGKSNNGGITWFHQTSPINNNSYTSAVDSLKAWAGYSGIVHTTDGGGPPVGITQINNEIPREYQLYQNYPNPFNPVTNIKYSVKSRQGGTGSQTSNVKLIVFDVQGKLVTELVNQKQNAGTYLVDWNASGYSSGVYFYSLIIDSKVIDTKRMLLIK